MFSFDHGTTMCLLGDWNRHHRRIIGEIEVDSCRFVRSYCLSRYFSTTLYLWKLTYFQWLWIFGCIFPIDLKNSETHDLRKNQQVFFQVRRKFNGQGWIGVIYAKKLMNNLDASRVHQKHCPVLFVPLYIHTFSINIHVN